MNLLTDEKTKIKQTTQDYTANSFTSIMKRMNWIYDSPGLLDIRQTHTHKSKDEQPTDCILKVLILK